MRTITPEAEEILDKKTAVLDHGYVILTDYMGGDSDIANAARVSNSGQVTKRSTDRGLIRYLFRKGHTSPFEMCELKFICKMPIFVARQWIRTRTASVNEVSGRYSVLPSDFYIPTEDSLSYQSKGNNQGRSDVRLPHSAAKKILSILKADAEKSFDHYHSFLGDTPLDGGEDLAENGGLAKELARIGLPLSTYTEWVWKIDLHNLLSFIRLRFDSHAQWEIQQYGKVLYDMAKAVAPLSTEAFDDYSRFSKRFSRAEMNTLLSFVTVESGRIVFREGSVGADDLKKRGMTDREVNEFFALFERNGS